MKIKFVQSLGGLAFPLLSLFVVFFSFGVGYKEEKLKSFIGHLKNKVKLKASYVEGPHQSDFFIENPESDNFAFFNLFDLPRGDGKWSGEFALSKESIFWTNPSLDKEKIYDLIQFGPYRIFLKTRVNSDKLLGIEIKQEDIGYGQVNFEIARNKSQINYWTKAKSSSWLETIRGKIFKVNEKELYTVFQTTVYEDKIPIYAFRGEAYLRKEAGDR